ncbi:MAG: DNA gyrase subunit A, partial [Clostridiales bacterium]
GITDLRDESDRKGMRIVIELKRDANPQIVLNHLYKNTQMQDNFGVINLALVNGMPQILTLKQMLTHYIKHQEEVIVRRTRFDLHKAEEREHIVEGLKIAVDNIDLVVQIVRSTHTDEESKQKLHDALGLTDKQAQAVIDMQLKRLNGLAVEKLVDELEELKRKIAYYKQVLSDEGMVLSIIKDEIGVIRQKYADERRTEITADENDLEVEDLIADEDVVITISHTGYIKRVPMDTYKSQKRGGKGITGMTTKEEDFVEQLFITSTHNYLMFFTNNGKCYRVKVYDIPETSRTSKGTAVVNLINIGNDEKITAVISVKNFAEEKYLLAVTRHGYVKKTILNEYDSSRKDGLIAINLEEGDELVKVALTDGKQELLLVTAYGMAIRFSEEEVRPIGRTGQGVHGIKLEKGDYVQAMDIVRADSQVLVITENGYGKRTKIDEYRAQSRGGKGIQTIKESKRNGNIVDMLILKDGEEILAVTTEGIIIRLQVADITSSGRATMGVLLMRLGENDKVIAMAKVINDNNVQ